MTKAMMKGIAVFACLAAVSVPKGLAADDTRGKAYVVIVGIDQYKDSQIIARKHAEADAKLLYDVVVDPGYFNVEPKNVKLLLGTDDPARKSQTATKENILQALNWIAKNAQKDDLAIVAFVCQGGTVGERTCYFTTDSTFKDRDKSALNSGDIEHVFDGMKSNRFVAFVDVNFKGFKAGKEPVSDPDGNKLYREFLGKDDDGPPLSRVIFLSNNGTKPSLDLPEHGLFTQVIADGLKGKADQYGYEADGVITVGELAKYVRKQMPEIARTVGKTDEEKSQRPIILEGNIGDFVLNYNPAVAQLNKKRLAEFEKIAQANKLSKLIQEEGLNYLARMPKLEALQGLRKQYQKLADGKLTAAEFVKERDSILEGMKLSAADAGEYARHVMNAVKVVTDNYFKKINTPQLVEAAIRGLYRHADEPIPPDTKEKLDNIKGLTTPELRTLLTEARQHLGRREDLASGKDVTFSLHPLMSKLDRHSDYIDPETLDKFQADIAGKFKGIGVKIKQNPTRDQLEVISPIPGSPAYRAKMFAGDIITHIVLEVDQDGKPLPTPEVIPTKGMSTDEAVKKIKGKPGTKVKVIVDREGEAKPIEFNLIRASVELETVLGIKRGADDQWDYVIDPENQICYVRLAGFQESTARDLEQLMKKLTKTGIKGFILDLRFNPGGLLDQAVKICDMFIDEGVIVTIKPRNGPEASYLGTGKGRYTSFPMVCLVNGYSASASEIVSACLQDHSRAIIMGSRSYGKGSVQTILDFRETKGKLKVTTATFWRPNGHNLNKASTGGKDDEDWGVMPDKGYNLPLKAKELNDLLDFQTEREFIQRPGRPPGVNTDFKDRQLEMALDYLRGQIKIAGPVPNKKAG
jgi:carboxyl-terminal processing protease